MFAEQLESRVFLTVPIASNATFEYLTRQALNVTFDLDVSESLGNEDM